MNTVEHYKACYTRPEQARQTHALYDTGITHCIKAIRAEISRLKGEGSDHD